MRYMLSLLGVLGFVAVRGIDFRLVIGAIIGSLVVGAIVAFFWKEDKWQNRRRPIKVAKQQLGQYLGKVQLCWGKGNRKRPATQKVAVPSLIRA